MKALKRILHLWICLCVIGGITLAQEETSKGSSQKKETEKETSQQVVVTSRSQEAADQGHSLSGDALAKYIDKKFPNSLAIPGTDIRFAITGYVKVDGIVDLDYVGDRYSFVTGTIALDDTPEALRGGQTTIFARESKLRFDFRSKTKRGTPLRAYVSGDFFDDSDPSSTFKLRLRHAYVQAGNFLAGQTWTTMSDLGSLPTILDWEAGDALLGGRAAMIRWQQQAGKHFSWALALENPRSTIDNPYSLPGESRQYIPNLVGRIIWSHKYGHIQLGGQATQLRWVSDSPGMENSAALSAGVNFTGALSFMKYNKFLWGLSYGTGWGQNIPALISAGSDAVVERDGSLTAFTSLVANCGLEIYWLRNLASTFGVAWAESNSPANRSPDAQEVGAAYHVNLRWAPVRMFAVGAEYMGGLKRVVDGREGAAQRIQISCRLMFN